MNAHAVDLRISALTVRFRQIGDEQMRDLPFYNPNLEVEAWDFSELDETQLIGVLITPWFMNLIVLRQVPEPIDSRRYGESQTIALPGGDRAFLYGGDPVVGALWAHSLHSPMQQFGSQMQARTEARLRLAQVLTRDERSPQALRNPGRRALFLRPPGL
jgi:[NiFe] hydrogenase assembly HybE family chaperone